VSADGTTDRFWAELRALYQAAGQPTLKRLVHLGLEQHPPIAISDSTINGWLNRKAVPTGRKNERYLTAMVAYLQARTGSGTRYRPLPPGEWGRLLRAAQAERAMRRRQGRPPRPNGPARVAGAIESTLTADVEVSEVMAGPGLEALFGRDRELAVLAGLVTGVATGRGSAALIEGEPGIGKSALVRAALAGAVPLGCQVFWGTGDELGQTLPFHPLLDGLHVREPSANPRRNTIVRLLRGEVTADYGADGLAVLAEQLLALIAEQCARRPVILVIDDLQWADQDSVRLWVRLARSVRQMPLLLIGMVRPVPRRDDLLALRRAVGDGARLPRTGLTGPAAADLVAALAGGQPDAELLRLAGDAAGNPLYLTELVSALTRSSRVRITETGVTTIAAGSAPRSLSAAIADRLGFVAGPEREALRAAALLGVDFAVADLAIVLNRGVSDLVRILDDACAAGVLAASGKRLRFRHPLIRSALYEEMPEPVRAAWHREAGRALAEAGAPVDRVARQLLLAVGGPDDASEPLDEWMLSWLAGTAGLLVGQAPQVAAELLRRGVASSPAGARHNRLAARLADALYRVGDAAGAEQVASRALDHTVEPDLLVDLLSTLALCRTLAGRFAESFTTLDRALASPGISARHRARLLVLAARTHETLGELGKAGEVAGNALAAAEADDRWAIGWALHVLTLVTAGQGHVTDAIPLFDRALAVAESDPLLTDLRLLLQINKAVTLGCLDRYEEARAVAGQARDLAGQVGATFRQAQAHSALGQLHFDTGCWDEALAEVGMVPDSMKEPTAVCCDLGIEATIRFHRGESEVARHNLAVAARYAERMGHGLVGSLTLARSLGCENDGTLPEALAVLADELDNEGVEELADLLTDAVRLATDTGNPGLARELTDRVVAFATGSEIPHRQADALYCRGLLDHDADRLLAAAERYGDASRPLMRAKALEAAAMEFARATDPDQARTAAAGAVEIYAWLGAAVDVARVQARL
jgi:tetratricopeptide (TPR) repeat protein